MSCLQLESVSTAARRINVQEQRFYGLVRENFFPPGVIVRLGRQIRVNPIRLEEFLATGGSALPGGWRKEASGAEAPVIAA
jgi:hypothetical protein